MKRRDFIQAGLLAGTSAAFGSGILSKSYAQSSIKTQDLPYFVLEGTPRQRGRIHGEALKPKIHEVIGIWKDFLHKETGMNPEVYLDEFLDKMNFKGALERWSPDLIEEVNGIAEASGLDLKTAFASQFMDEEWWYRRNRNCGPSSPDGMNCTALGVFDQGGLPPLLGQNMDIAKYVEGFEVIFRIKHENSSLESYVFSYAGLIALLGINNHSIGVCCNTLMQLDPSTDGLPVAFVVRRLLEHTKLEGAVEFIHEIKHASGQNYSIGGPDKIVAYECSANKVVRFVPYENASRIFHTNHPIVNNDQGLFNKLIQKCPRKSGVDYLPNTVSRCKAMEVRLDDFSKTIQIKDIKEALSSHDDPQNKVCRHGERGYTNGSVVYELSASPVLHLAPGPPCETKYQIYTF